MQEIVQETPCVIYGDRTDAAQEIEVEATGQGLKVVIDGKEIPGVVAATTGMSEDDFTTEVSLILVCKKISFRR